MTPSQRSRDFINNFLVDLFPGCLITLAGFLIASCVACSTLVYRYPNCDPHCPIGVQQAGFPLPMIRDGSGVSSPLSSIGKAEFFNIDDMATLNEAAFLINALFYYGLFHLTRYIIRRTKHNREQPDVANEQPH